MPLRRIFGACGSPLLLAMLPAAEGWPPERHAFRLRSGGRRGLGMAVVFFGLLIGLELKHFVADYLMQPGWMLSGKGNIFHPGGYAHAAIHAALSLVVLLLVGTPLGLA